jgi:hypothetical protein
MRLRAFSAFVIAAAVFASAPAVRAEDKAEYKPAKGNDVVIYTHHFKPDTFAAGLKLVEEGFTAAQAKMGQTRKNYFLVNPDTHDVVVVSFFDEGMSVDEWHKFVGRLDVLEQIEPMRREPLEVEPFTVDAITAAP